MAKKSASRTPYVQPYRYPSPDIPLSAIRRFARRIAERFQPDKIILFGSYAYGTPHNESDVDLLVIMPARNAIDQALKIDLAFEPPFCLDLIVRTPRQIERGFRDDNWFVREIVEKGTVLYEAPDGRLGPQGRRGHQRGTGPRGAKAPAAKRGRLPQPTSGREIPEGADATTRPRGAKDPRAASLLNLLVPLDPTLRPLRRILRSLERYAVDYRYPDENATSRQMRAALRHAERVRAEVRTRLGLRP